MASRKEPCEKAIDYHLPVLERCWLLYSDKSYGIAKELQSTARFGHLIPDENLKHVEDVNDPLEFYRKIDAIYHNLPAGWGESAVIADYLGMTANASVGMALACMYKTRPLQYTVPQFGTDMTAEKANDPIEIELMWDMVGAAPIRRTK